MVKNNIGDFIEQQTALMHTVNTNEDWCEDIALAMLSTVSHNVKFYSSMGQIDLNLWIIAVAPSSTGKSTNFKNYVNPLLQKMKELGGNQKTDYQFSSSFTVEAMTEYISGEGNHNGIIIRDEISSLFKETSGKGYNVRLQEFLSELYDGKLSKRTTIAHGTTEPSYCYVTLLGGATPYLYSVLDKQIFVQGLGGRILWEVFPVVKREFDRNSFFNLTGLSKKDNEIEEAAKKLITLPSLDITIKINSDSEAALMLEQKHNKIEDRKKKLLDSDSLNLEGTYLGKLFVHLLKLSALKRLARELPNINRDKGTSHSLMVEAMDVEWAINRIDKFHNNFLQMLKEWRTQPVEAPIQSVANYREKFLGVLKLQGGIAKRPKLIELLNWDSKRFGEITEMLKETGDVRILSKKEIKELKPELLNKCEIKLNNNLPQVFILTEYEIVEGEIKEVVGQEKPYS